jgi:hypothetical protein
MLAARPTNYEAQLKRLKTLYALELLAEYEDKADEPKTTSQQ